MVEIERFTDPRAVLVLGARVCLSADADNPVSTGVYVRLGYRPLALTGRFELGGVTR